jgi:hypothetical protein
MVLVVRRLVVAIFESKRLAERVRRRWRILAIGEAELKMWDTLRYSGSGGVQG